jgi:hypothetical protein
MPTVLVNGSAFAPEADAGSWGPLLDAVDRHVAPTGEIVAAVRFDGVDEPGFREEAILVRPLTSDLIVEIDTLTPAVLLDGVLDEGRASLPMLERAARELAQGFRGPRVETASHGLGQFAESLMNLLSLVVAAAQAAGNGLDTIQGAQGPVLPVVAALDGALQPLLEANGARDWITVADILEYDVAPLLSRFEGIFDALRQPAAG